MRVVLFFVLAIAATPSHALDLIRCKIGETSHGWVARTLILAYEPGEESAVVADDIGLYFTGGPSEARITADTPKSLRFTWRLKGISDGRGNLTGAMIYRARLTRGSRVVRISAEPLGYPQTFSGRGKCGPVSDKERQAFEALMDKVG